MKRYLFSVLLSVSLLATVGHGTYISWMPEGIEPVGEWEEVSSQLPVFSEGLMLVSQEMEGELFYGYVNYDGTYGIAPVFRGGRAFSEGLACVKGEELFGFIDTSGGFVIEPKFLDGMVFSEGLCGVEVTEGKWGFINDSGKLVILAEYDSVSDFRNGYAVVEKGGKLGLINGTGGVVFDFIYSDVLHGDGLYPVSEGGLYGLSDLSGILVEEYLYESMGEYEDELSLVAMDGMWGYLDNTGSIAITPSYDSADSFEDGVAWVEESGVYSYIDTSGHGQLVMYGMDEVTSFSDGYARGKQGEYYGFFDKTGMTTVSFQYLDAVPVTDGVGLVFDGVKWGMFYPSDRASEWAMNYVSQARELGVFPSSFQGIDMTSTVNRGQFATLAVTIYDLFAGTEGFEAGENPFAVPSLTVNPFVDTRDVYARRAYALHLTTGVSEDTFGFYDNLTREQAATMLLTLYKNLTGDEFEPQGAPDFNDHGLISEWAKESVYILAEKGIITGVGDNYFAPRDPISAESALVMAIAFCNELGYR